MRRFICGASSYQAQGVIESDQPNSQPPGLWIPRQYEYPGRPIYFALGRSLTGPSVPIEWYSKPFPESRISPYFRVARRSPEGVPQCGCRSFLSVGQLNDHVTLVLREDAPEEELLSVLHRISMTDERLEERFFGDEICIYQRFAKPPEPVRDELVRCYLRSILK